jgi:glycosyltransferase involved in cell wall biosynthesis
MKFLIICSLARNTGGYLRGQYLEKSLKVLGHDVVYVKSFKRLPLETYYIFSLPYYLYKALTTKADVAICLKPFPNATIPILLKKFTKTKTVVDVDDLDYGFSKLGKIVKAVQVPAIKHFDLVTVHNENLYNLVTNEYKIKKEKVYRIEQGVPFEIFDKNKYDAKKTRKELGIDDKKVIVYTGHLSRSSDLEPILSIFKETSKKIDNMLLLVVGGGVKYEGYAEMAKQMGIENINFTGFVKAEKAAEYVNAGDACIVYYPKTEGNKYRSSMKLREYLAMGKPVICNSFADLERFKEYTYQFSNDNEAEEAFRKALQPDKREAKGQKYIEENMNWKKVAEKIVERIKAITS